MCFEDRSGRSLIPSINTCTLSKNCKQSASIVLLIFNDWGVPSELTSCSPSELGACDQNRQGLRITKSLPVSVCSRVVAMARPHCTFYWSNPTYKWCPHKVYCRYIRWNGHSQNIWIAAANPPGINDRTHVVANDW